MQRDCKAGLCRIVFTDKDAIFGSCFHESYTMMR
jgi:hypothetical protein